MPSSIIFALCVMIWGSTWYAIELQLGYTPIAWSLTFRFGLAAVLLFIITIARGHALRFPIKSHIWFVLIGLFLFSGNYFLTYNGAQHLTSGVLAVAFSMIAVFNIFLSRIFLKHSIEIGQLIAAAFGILGLALIFRDEVSSFSLADSGLIGLAFAIAATMMASMGNIVAATPQAKSFPLFSYNAWGMFYGTLFNITFSLVQGDPFVFDPRAEYWGALIFLSVIGTVAAFTLYLHLLNSAGIALASYVNIMVPIVALIISTVFEGYQWTVSSFTGVLLVVFGNVLMANRRRSAQKKAAAQKAAA